METESSYYEVSTTAMSDKSELGAHGQQLCENLDVFRMTETSPRASLGRLTSVSQ